MSNAEKYFLWVLIIFAIALTTKGTLLRASSVATSNAAADKNIPVSKAQTLQDIRHAKDGPVSFVSTNGSEPVVTFIKYWANKDYFFIESPDATAGLRVDTQFGKFMPVSLSIGNNITHMEGTMVTTDKARKLILSAAPQFSPGKTDDMPKPVKIDVKSFGGKRDGYTPGTINAVGRNTDGMIVRVVGRSAGYSKDAEYEQFYLDDGSGVPSCGGHCGVEVYRSRANCDPCVQFPIKDGTLVEAEGIGTSREMPGIGRIRCLIVRYDNKGIVSDQVRSLKP